MMFYFGESSEQFFASSRGKTEGASIIRINWVLRVSRRLMLLYVKFKISIYVRRSLIN